LHFASLGNDQDKAYQLSNFTLFCQDFLPCVFLPCNRFWEALAFFSRWLKEVTLRWHSVHVE